MVKLTGSITYIWRLLCGHHAPDTLNIITSGHLPSPGTTGFSSRSISPRRLSTYAWNIKPAINIHSRTQSAAPCTWRALPVSLPTVLCLHCPPPALWRHPLIVAQLTFKPRWIYESHITPSTRCATVRCCTVSLTRRMCIYVKLTGWTNKLYDKYFIKFLLLTIIQILD